MFLTSTRVPNASVPRGRSETFASTRIWPRSMSASLAPIDAQQQLELLGVAARLLGGPDVGLGDDLHQRRAGAVEVDQATPRARRRGRVAVDELGRVLLEVGARDRDRERARPTSRSRAARRAASGIAYWLIW